VLFTGKLYVIGAGAAHVIRGVALPTRTSGAYDVRT
jgi:hypothetical protein